MTDAKRSSNRSAVDAEVNLLPAWYPAVVRRRRWLVLQAWGTACLVVVLGTLLLLRRDDEQANLRTLASIEADREATELQLAEVAASEIELRELTRAAEGLEQVGLPVEVAPLLAEIASLLPDNAVLTEVGFVEGASKLPAGLEKSKLKTMVPRSEWLDIRVAGVARETSDVARLLEQVQANPLHREAAIAYLQETDENGEPVMRFQIQFKITTKRGDSGPDLDRKANPASTAMAASR